MVALIIDQKTKRYPKTNRNRFINDYGELVKSTNVNTTLEELSETQLFT